MKKPESLEFLLNRLLEQQEIKTEKKQQRAFLAYLRLLHKWNRVYNLTAVRHVEDMVALHVMDALSVLPHLKGGRILDVGSGAGLPGIPVAIMRPEMEFNLLDSNAKKTRFLIQAKSELALDNLTVTTSRVEKYSPEQKFDTVVSRAFASIGKMLQYSARLCEEKGIFLAMKGEFPQDELKQLPDNYYVEGVYEARVSGLNAQRHIVCISRNPNVALSL